MSSDEMLHQIAALEPMEAKKLLTAFEAQGIPFEVESDHSALAKPGRFIEQYLGMYPEGSKLLVFVPEPHVARAESVFRELFPV